jgi:hypothetical protein
VKLVKVGDLFSAPTVKGISAMNIYLHTSITAHLYLKKISYPK